MIFCDDGLINVFYIFNKFYFRYILAENDFFSEEMSDSSSVSSSSTDTNSSVDEEVDIETKRVKKNNTQTVTEEDMEILKKYHDLYNPYEPYEYYMFEDDDNDSMDDNYEEDKPEEEKRRHRSKHLKDYEPETVVVTKPFWKSKRILNPLKPIYFNIPPQIPIPRKLARTIAPFTGYTEFPFIPSDSKYYETDIMTYDLKQLNKKFVGVLLDVPWLLESKTETENCVSPEMLYNLRLDEIVDEGLIFVWTEKECISGCVKTLARWGFVYVENLVWVKQNVDYTVANQPYHVFNKSITTLLIFKKGDKVNIRHQRNPDVVFDVVKKGKYLTEDKPMFVYNIIETLLPDGIGKGDNSGGFLEL